MLHCFYFSKKLRHFFSILVPIKIIFNCFTSFFFNIISQYLNIVVPARFGELLKAWLASRKYSISGSYVLGTVVIEKIVEGKMRKYYAENCLLAQPFVKDDKKSVAEVLAEAAKSAGGTAKIKRFVRFEVG